MNFFLTNNKQKSEVKINGKRQQYRGKDTVEKNVEKAFSLYNTKGIPLSEALWDKGILDPSP